MTETTKQIFESFEVRKTGRQKQAFRDWVIPELERMGYPVTVEKGSFGSRNIVIGDVDRAKVLFTAHYDTCARLPFPNFITPKNFTLYLSYQLLIVAVMLLTAAAGGMLAGLISEDLSHLGTSLTLFVFCWMLLAGPANPHTANDNTSGVTAILDLAREMPEEQRSKAAFVLFDLEEAGLIGSASFAKAHPQVRDEIPVVNLDCVSDGTTLFFAVSKPARIYTERLRQAFLPDGGRKLCFSETHHLYPSDQANFRRGIGVATLNETKGGILYMNRIHTPKDVIYQEEPVAEVVRGCLILTGLV